MLHEAALKKSSKDSSLGRLLGRLVQRKKMLNIGHSNVRFSLSFVVSFIRYTNKGPAMAPTRRSATIRFIIRYVLRLRKWRILAKAVTVMALIIEITRNSVMKTGNQILFSPAVWSSVVRGTLGFAVLRYWPIFHAVFR